MTTIIPADYAPDHMSKDISKSGLIQFILITDSDPAINGAGISQTLYNLFSHELFLPTVLLLNGEIAASFGSRLQGTVVYCRKAPLKLFRSRLGKWINPWITRTQMEWRQRHNAFLPNYLPSKEQSFVLVSTSVPEKLHLAWCMLRQGYTVIPYFMDDWLAGNQLKWKGGNIQQVAKDILQAAPCWLMISRQLEKTLRERYLLEKKPCLIVHNPAPAPLLSPQRGEVGDDNTELTVGNTATVVRSPSTVLSNKSIANSQPSPLGGVGGGRLIIYAGSIWPMHADALIATARAIHHLNEAVLQDGKDGQRLTPASPRGRVNDQLTVVRRPSSVVPRLTIYTGEAHWKKYQSQLEGPGVTYGGWKPYNEIHKALQDAWLLLCTASFEEQHKAFSDSSVQTKLTDYMAVGKPVLFVGPADAASGVFVDEHDIGFTMETNMPEDIAARLEAIDQLPLIWKRRANNALNLAVGPFCSTELQKKLSEFLERSWSMLK